METDQGTCLQDIDCVVGLLGCVFLERFQCLYVFDLVILAS